MKAFVLHSNDGPGALIFEERPDPVRTADAVIVSTHALGLNFPDLLITQGRYHIRPQLPFVPGCEIAGRISYAPPGSDWSVGDRVAAFVWQGGFAESTSVPLDHLVPIPDDMPFDDAAALLLNHHTAYFALHRRGGLRAGESVLVLGAAGGVGSAAVQVAKALGARVIAGITRPAGRAVAAEAGADEVIELADGFSRDVRGLTGGLGVDVVLDPVGDWLFVEATRCLAFEGRILVVGFAAGDIPTITANRLLLKNISAVGVGWGAAVDLDRGVLTEGATALHRLYSQGLIRPQISRRFSFADIPRALTALLNGEVGGKGVIAVR